MTQKENSTGKPSDIWSLGCTVVEMLTGGSPWPNFQTNWHPNAVLYHVREQTARGKTPFIPEWLPPEGKQFLQKCFIIDPTKRATADDLLKEPFILNNTWVAQSPMTPRMRPSIDLSDLDYYNEGEDNNGDDSEEFEQYGTNGTAQNGSHNEQEEYESSETYEDEEYDDSHQQHQLIPVRTLYNSNTLPPQLDSPHEEYPEPIDDLDDEVHRKLHIDIKKAKKKSSFRKSPAITPQDATQQQAQPQQQPQQAQPKSPLAGRKWNKRNRQQ